jgi:peptidoglycan/LPS O-acetylase OafA/YrhL
MSSANGPSATTAHTPHAAYLGKAYFTEMDGLRALSALMVIGVHLYDSGERWWWLAGERGVTIFFVLSGWLITTLALREEGRRGSLCLRAFYVRRSFRILPLYYVTLGLYCLLVFVLPFSPHMRDPLNEALPCLLLYFQEFQVVLWWARAAPEMVFAHSWSLGVEEKFYLLWPLLAFILWRSGRKRGRGALALAVAFAVLAVGVAPLGPVARASSRVLMGYCSLLTGCLLALLLHDPAWFNRLRWLGRPIPTMVAVVFLLASHLATPRLAPPASDFNNVAYTLATAMLMICLLTGEGPLHACLRCGPLSFIGRLSYGVYLVHMLAIAVVSRLAPLGEFGWAGSVLNYVLVCGASIVAAWGLHKVVEAPCISLGRRWSQRLLARADQVAVATGSLQARAARRPSPAGSAASGVREEKAVVA